MASIKNCWKCDCAVEKGEDCIMCKECLLDYYMNLRDMKVAEIKKAVMK